MYFLTVRRKQGSGIALTLLHWTLRSKTKVMLNKLKLMCANKKGLYGPFLMVVAF
jgi:hypothetical protein